MTQLIFRYSDIYDQMIASWLGKKWKNEYAKNGFKYVEAVQGQWNKINNKVLAVFESFGFKLPDWWLAYPITGWKETIPFSDPLTFWISNDWDYIDTTLIHELAHVEFTYYENEKLTNKIYKYVERTFAKEERVTIIHLPVNLLQLGVMAKVFPKKYEKMLARQKSFPRLKRAWEIIEENKDKINLSQPIESILKLKPK